MLFGSVSVGAYHVVAVLFGIWQHFQRRLLAELHEEHHLVVEVGGLTMLFVVLAGIIIFEIPAQRIAVGGHGREKIVECTIITELQIVLQLPAFNLDERLTAPVGIIENIACEHLFGCQSEIRPVAVDFLTEVGGIRLDRTYSSII